MKRSLANNEDQRESHSRKKVEKLVNTFNTGLLISNNTAAFESNEDIHQEERINTQTATSVTEAQALSDPLMITHRGSPNDNIHFPKALVGRKNIVDEFELKTS